MARRKEVEKVTEKYAEMKCGRVKKVVKSWQYYSILDFCRSFGQSREKSEWIARWCEGAKAGDDMYSDDGLSILIVER